jgi:hypothetical protein
MFVQDIQLTVKRRVGIDQPVHRIKLNVVELFFSFITNLLVDELID